MFLDDCFYDDKSLAVDWERVEGIPEMAMLKNCQQSPKWHQEGNAWIHTRRVVEEACLKSYDFGDPALKKKLILSALLHDIGKCKTTFPDKNKPGVWHSYNHEFEGERLIMEIFGDDSNAEEVAVIVRHHMAVLNLLDKKTPYESIIEMVREVGGKDNFDVLVALKECDLKGSEPEDKIGQAADFLRLREIQQIADVLYGESVYGFEPHLKGEFEFEKFLRDYGR